VPRPRAWVTVPAVLAVANAVAFLLIRPGVNDLWAARARASAARHGVGLTYWFSWFGGGSTPGNYSVLTPYLSALLSAELVGALSAVLIAVLSAALVDGLPHRAAATSVAALGAGINLWSGRIPFLLGCAFGVAALIAVRRRRPGWAVLATVLTILASPVSAAFVALGLAGTVLVRRTHRVVALATIATVVVGFGLVALAFGTPGPQKFSTHLFVESVGACVLFLLARPPRDLRIVVWLSMAVALAMFVIPNGMGSNFARMTWFCLPVAVVALSPWRAWFALVLVTPVLVSGGKLTVSDLRQADQPVAGTAFYKPLAAELDTVKGLSNYRLEVVSQHAHAAYDALLGHAMLARGWESQEDNHLNAALKDPGLDATSYKIWLDNNSVGWVAIPRSKIETFPEYTLVASERLSYLDEVWHNGDWSLYRVKHSVPIVTAPQTIVQYSQATLTIHTACACAFHVRIHYSKYLHATATAGGAGQATLADDGYGYTSMTTTAPGDYVLRGSVKALFH
jgi:hypothetical protein